MNIVKAYLWRSFIAVSILLAATVTHAQIELSSGIDLNYPLLLNKENTKINYGQITFGLRLGLAYKPENTQFFPMLNLSWGRTRLPLTDFATGDVAAMSFNYLNVLLNENYIVRFNSQNELYIYGGIGFSYLTQKGLKLSGSGTGLMESTIDSVENFANLFPAVNIGFEYNYGESAGKPLYLTLGIDFQYIMLLAERNNYYITVREQNNQVLTLNPTLMGNVISPGFYIAIHYLVPHFKKSGMYL